MLLSFIKTALKAISYVMLFASLCFVTILWWKFLASRYLNLEYPVGGDYYTGITYALNFAKHARLPPATWLSFWNAGTPVVGGYQWLTFYLILPLSLIFDVYSSLDIVSLGAILLYLIFSHLLFWQISKNHLVSIGLSLINLTSQSVYYQLVWGGMITGSAMQFYLPLSLFFLFRFLESPQRIRSLILTGIVGAIALIQHPTISILFVVLPTIIILFLKEFTSTSSRRLMFKRVFIYTFLLFSVGAIGIFPYLFSMSFTETASKCDNPQCWGIYPLHIDRWLGWLPVWLVAISLILTLSIVVIRKILGHSTSIKFLVGPFVALLVITFYPVAAYIHLIPTLANSIFPRRMFWVILLLSLVFGAHAYHLVRRSNRYVGWGLSLVFIVSLVLFLPIKINSKFNFDVNPPLTGELPNAVPNYVYQWAIPKYAKDTPITYFLPDWLLKSDANYRFDSLNAAVIHWWNLVSQTPATRGYTSSFNPHQTSWAYFLQTSLHREQSAIENQTHQNRAKFLLDAYAIRYAYLQDYHSGILKEELVEQSQNNFVKFREEVSTPIVYPTSTPPLLFIGDDLGYDTFIRSLADINFNSRKTIPVKGPVSLDSINPKDLKQFPTLFLYRFEGNMQKLDTYLTNGGTVFIELGSLKGTPKNMEKILPFSKFEVQEATTWDLTATDSNIFDNVDMSEFAPLKYQEVPWKLMLSKPGDIKSAAEVLLTQDGKAVITSLSYGKGKLFVSGINLPYHLIEYHNENEAKLYTNLLNQIIPSGSSPPEVEIRRMSPHEITISGNGMSGVYFKENFHPGWKAYVDNSQVEIYPAGLHFMYIPVAKKTVSQVKLRFTGAKTDWILFYISISSLLLSLFAIINPRFAGKLIHVSSQALKRLFIRSTRRWQKDEHVQY